MAGNQVLEWTDFDTAIKTAGLKDVRGYLMTFAVTQTRENRISWLPLICEYVECPG
jgi:hypothetical protein